MHTIQSQWWILYFQVRETAFVLAANNRLSVICWANYWELKNKRHAKSSYSWLVLQSSVDVRGESCAWQGIREIQQVFLKKGGHHCCLLNKYYNIGSGTEVLLKVRERRLNLGRLKQQSCWKCKHTFICMHAQTRPPPNMHTQSI